MVATILQLLRIALFTGGLTYGLLVLGNDIVTYHKVVSGDYLTPWYPKEWWKAPYTHARIAFKPFKEQWVKNYPGTQLWHTREVQIGEHKFWTVLEEKNIKAGKS